MSGASEDPRTLVRERLARASARPEAWIDLRREDALAEELQNVLERRDTGEHLPLAGTLFAVKGNIDVAGLPTTAACPSYAYMPDQDAATVARLRAAGAVVLGTTNLDQFATGLVGTRSPYGAVRHAFDAERISGGSSSGSAVAVALGAANFALGTDTAGSGRVPAAFHGLYGIKPTKGWVPASGVVPACRTLDVVTVMAEDLSLTQTAAEIMRGPDSRDPRSERDAEAAATPSNPRIGVPKPRQLGRLAPGWQEAFDAEQARWQDHAEVVEVDIEPFLSAAHLLYEGASVAERYTAVGSFIEEALASGVGDVDPTAAKIITGAKSLPAHQLFADLEQLDQAAAYARQVFAGVDALLLPVTTQHPTLEAVAADPVGINTDMGRFTNFANLLDLSAVAYPAGTAAGLPFGTQLVAPAFHDDALTHLIERHHV
ncbi:allophanate hydrolase [Nesterenkonia populi]